MPKRASQGALDPPNGQWRCVKGAASAVDPSEEARDIVSIRVLLSYPPGANRLWRHFHGRMMVAPDAAGWKREVAWRVKAAGVRQMTGPVAVELVLHPRRAAKGLASKTRLDLDAPIKPLMDALIYRLHPSHPGFGWIEPVMSMDDPMIAKDVAEAIITYHNQQLEVAYASGVDMAEILGYGGNIE